jgi:exonuclease III
MGDRRIDYFFVDATLRPRLAYADVREAEASDHHAIVLDLALE